MKLTYRGVSYDYNPNDAQTPVAASPTQQPRSLVSLIYRGVFYALDPNARYSPSPVAANATLMYRGNTYQLNEATSEVEPVSTINGIPFWASLNSSFRKQTDLSKIHQRNVYQNVQRRLQKAREQGNQHLIQLLEQELQQFA